MGRIKKVLAMGEVEPRYLTAHGMWTDLCENVHLHYRNIRFDFSETEFALFRSAMNNLGMAVEHCTEQYEYKEGDPNFLVQQSFNTPLKSDSEYYPNRVSIELQRDNTVHLHYRDLRLHFTLEEFKQIARLFKLALNLLGNIEEFPYKDTTELIRAWIKLSLIQPYDEGHRPMDTDKEHREGIEFVKQLIKEKKKIRPILVATNGQRLDGFKRYMAHLELGLGEIECIVDPFGQMGGQHNQNFIDD
jgi:hypothetical protein